MANPQTFRMWVPQRRGRADLHFRAPFINHFTVVHIAVSEATGLDQIEVIPLPNGANQTFKAHQGDASISLQNVTVEPGVVHFRVFVDWDSPLNLVTDLTFFDPPVEVVIGS